NYREQKAEGEKGRKGEREKRTLREKGNQRVFRLPVGEKALSQMVFNWRDALLNRQPKETEYARDLYNALLAPVLQAEGVKGNREQNHHVTSSPFHPFTPSRIVVVADGPLLDLPFAALRDAKGQRLVERYSISTSVSLGILAWPDDAARP